MWIRVSEPPPALGPYRPRGQHPLLGLSTQPLPLLQLSPCSSHFFPPPLQPAHNTAASHRLILALNVPNAFMASYHSEGRSGPEHQPSYSLTSAFPAILPFAHSLYPVSPRPLFPACGASCTTVLRVIIGRWQTFLRGGA